MGISTIHGHFQQQTLEFPEGTHEIRIVSPSPLRSPDFFTAVAQDAAGPDVPPEQVVMIGAAVVFQGLRPGGFRTLSVAKMGEHRRKVEDVTDEKR